jgi:hypothetical protein
VLTQFYLNKEIPYTKTLLCDRQKVIMLPYVLGLDELELLLCAFFDALLMQTELSYP